MKVPKVTSIILVILLSLTFLNFMLKYYTYFVLMVSSTKKQQELQDAQGQLSPDTGSQLAQETGEIPHPHELFVPLLTFIPTKSPVLSRPWVLVTSSFIEENFFELFISLLLIFYLSRYLETIWGSKELSKFVIINVIVSNVTIYVYYNLKKLAFGELTNDNLPPVILSSMSINMGFIIAIKQRIANHYLIFFKGNLRIKVNYLPFLTIVFTWILSLLSEEFLVLYVMSIVGFIVSWTYLRFFKSGANERQSYLLPFALTHNKKKNRFRPIANIGSSSTDFPIENDSVRGDRSEQFALYTFFPYPVSLIVKFVSNRVFLFLVKHKFLNPHDFTLDEGSDEDNDNGQELFEDVDNLKNNLFGVSSLKGAGEVSTIPKSIWDWLIPGKDQRHNSIKTSMDKRRKLALKELE
ncbi:Rhomboid-like protein 19 [Candida viswanathii]|uniref:Rhomboid-like protein 19 n=1 Tax=Candida viswanathii TaxID=5486 RepID=A0A367YGH6_9ASCO|nr:Rhomboid-like protein 19 [Candida viswanathii]